MLLALVQATATAIALSIRAHLILQTFAPIFQNQMTKEDVLLLMELEEFDTEELCTADDYECINVHRPLLRE